MNKQQLRELIEVTLKPFPFNQPEAINLLMGTAAQETHLGEFLRQLGKGPALGWFQMEPSSFEDIMHNYLYYRPELEQHIKQVCNVQQLTPSCLHYNLKVAIIFARLKYLRAPGKIPSSIEGMAEYWKEHYNTRLGKGTMVEFIENYKRFVL